MKKVTHEIKLEKSVKIILGVLALGIVLNAAPKIQKSLFTEAHAAGSGPIYRVTLCNHNDRCGYTGR